MIVDGARQRGDGHAVGVTRSVAEGDLTGCPLSGQGKSQTLLAKPIVVTAAEPALPQWHLRCPHCERFTLVCVGLLPKQARACPEPVERGPPV